MKTNNFFKFSALTFIASLGGISFGGMSYAATLKNDSDKEVRIRLRAVDKRFNTYPFGYGVIFNLEPKQTYTLDGEYLVNLISGPGAGRRLHVLAEESPGVHEVVLEEISNGSYDKIYRGKMTLKSLISPKTTITWTGSEWNVIVSPEATPVE